MTNEHAGCSPPSVVVALSTLCLLAIGGPLRAEPVQLGPDADAIAPVRQLINDQAQDQDDLCVWIDPRQADDSLIICSDKSAGRVFVYTLQGGLHQEIEVPKPGNIDIRQDVLLGGQRLDLVVVNQREDDLRLVPFQVNHETRRLERLDESPLHTGPNYGGCLATDAATSRVYFVSTSESGTVEQFDLLANGPGRITGRKVRDLTIGKCEGAVADDVTGTLYIAEETVGIWKVAVDPQSPAEPRLIARIGEHGLAGDLEGLAIARDPANQADLLLVSDQGRSCVVALRLSEPHEFVGQFSIAGAEETDGIDVVTAPLGRQFPHGLFLCHTDRAPRPVLVTPWQNVSARLRAQQRAEGDTP